MDSPPAFAMDKPFAPSTVRGPEPPENPQSRKNFSVSHLLDLEEVAAGMNGAPPAGPPPSAGGKAMPEPSGGSSGSEAAPQDGEYRRPGKGPPLYPQSRAMGWPRCPPHPPGRAERGGQRGAGSPRGGVGAAVGAPSPWAVGVNLGYLWDRSRRNTESTRRVGRGDTAPWGQRDAGTAPAASLPPPARDGAELPVRPGAAWPSRLSPPRFSGSGSGGGSLGPEERKAAGPRRWHRDTGTELPLSGRSSRGG